MVFTSIFEVGAYSSKNNVGAAILYVRPLGVPVLLDLKLEIAFFTANANFLSPHRNKAAAPEIFITRVVACGPAGGYDVSNPKK